MISTFSLWLFLNPSKNLKNLKLNQLSNNYQRESWTNKRRCIDLSSGLSFQSMKVSRTFSTKKALQMLYSSSIKKSIIAIPLSFQLIHPTSKRLLTPTPKSMIAILWIEIPNTISRYLVGWTLQLLNFY